MAAFLKVARVALADSPQALEQLFVVARSAPTPAQRQGKVKAAATRRQKRLAAQSVLKAA